MNVGDVLAIYVTAFVLIICGTLVNNGHPTAAFVVGGTYLAVVVLGIAWLIVDEYWSRRKRRNEANLS